jgi:hypothetical protein
MIVFIVGGFIEAVESLYSLEADRKAAQGLPASSPGGQKYIKDAVNIAGAYSILGMILFISLSSYLSFDQRRSWQSKTLLIVAMLLPFIAGFFILERWLV